MNLQKSFRQALRKLFSYKFTWVSRHKLLRDCCNLVRSFKSHSESNQNIIVGWLSWIQLSISARNFGGRRSHAHGKPSQLHHAQSSKAKQYEREVGHSLCSYSLFACCNSAVNKGWLCAGAANSNVCTYFRSMTSSPIIAWAKGYLPP